MPGTILIVEDEPMVAEVVGRYLRRDGYEVEIVHDGLAGLRRFQEQRPDLVVLDIMLPGMDGLDVCLRIRESADTPIILLTSRSGELDKVQGLGLGADDYVTKPFSPRELAARVDAVLRRSTRPSREEAGSDRPLHYGDLLVDPAARAVELGGMPVSITAREFDLLLHFARHPSRVFTREQLADAAWTHDFEGDLNTVTVQIRRLRTKVEPDPSRPRHLKTVWGVGYKFEP